MTDQASLKALMNVYRSSLKGIKMGVFLGAGTSTDSRVPNFKNFAFNAFQEAFHNDLRFRQRISNRLKDYIDKQATLSNPDLNPEELFIIIKKNFRSDLEQSSVEWKKAWLHFCAEQLYKDSKAMRRSSKNSKAANWRIRKEVYQDNTTLKSVISFCMAQSRDFEDPVIRSYLNSSKFAHHMGWNPRIGGVLTTNYDDLFEATINHKFSRTKGTVYGSRAVFEGIKPKNRLHLLEVEHIHGFLMHRVDYYKTTNKKELVDIVATETDFFKTFYESMSFSNYAGMRFFDNFHTLFIGCKMNDKNIRRFLYHLSESQHPNTHKFAILRGNCKKKHIGKRLDTFCPDCLDNSNIFTEELLKTYGVRVIWVCNYSQIPKILEKVYRSAGGKWNRVYNEMW